MQQGGDTNRRHFSRSDRGAPTTPAAPRSREYHSPPCEILTPRMSTPSDALMMDFGAIIERRRDTALVGFCTSLGALQTSTFNPLVSDDLRARMERLSNRVSLLARSPLQHMPGQRPEGELSELQRIRQRRAPTTNATNRHAASVGLQVARREAPRRTPRRPVARLPMCERSMESRDEPSHAGSRLRSSAFSFLPEAPTHRLCLSVH